MNKKNVLLYLLIFAMMSCLNEAKDKSNVNLEMEKKSLNDKKDNGVEHGEYLSFYDNGKVAESGVKIKGKKNGLWKYYNPKGTIDKAKHYYNDSLIYNLDVNDFKYVETKIDNNVQVKIPFKWEVVKQNNLSPVLLTIKKRCEVSFCPNLTITNDSKILLQKEEIDSYLEKSNTDLDSNMNNYRVIKERKYESDGNIYFEKIYTGNVMNTSIGGITTWIFNKNNTYIVTGLALNEKENSFLKFEGLFKDIIYNLEIK